MKCNAQSCLTLCDPMDCSLPGSSVREILLARILEWVAIPFAKGSAQPWILHCRQILYHLSHQGSTKKWSISCHISKQGYHTHQ